MCFSLSVRTSRVDWTKARVPMCVSEVRVKLRMSKNMHSSLRSVNTRLSSFEGEIEDRPNNGLTQSGM